MLSTLVLVQDAEYELQVSVPQVLFPQWGTSQAHARCIRISISLTAREAHESSPDAPPACVPLVLTAPFTARFTVSGPSTETTPLMPLLFASHVLQYEVVFVPPKLAESDSMWDNFQDQLVVQTRLARLVVPLFALRTASRCEDCASDSFTPLVLPEVRSPSFRLLEQVETRGRLEHASIKTAAPVAKPTGSSTSFHPSRMSSVVLAPIGHAVPPSQAELDQSPSKRPTTPHDMFTPLPPQPRECTEVNNQAEARQVILRLRARRSSQKAKQSSFVARRATGLTQLSEANNGDSFGGSNDASLTDSTITGNNEDPPGPEVVGLDAKTQAELAVFNAIVVDAKSTVAQQRETAKQELDYYKPHLPNDLMVMAPVTTVPLGITPTRPRTASKPARLPTLKPVSSSPADPERISNEDNQETSPVKQKSSSRQEPQQTPAMAKEASRSKAIKKPGCTMIKTASTPRNRTSAGRPLKAAITVSMSRSNHQTNDSIIQPAVGRSTSTKSYDALEDFDAPDPEIDDAPMLPDDLCGRRAGDADEEDLFRMMGMQPGLHTY